MLLLLLMMMMQCEGTGSARAVCVQCTGSIHAVHMHAVHYAHACVTRKEAAEARESASPPFFHRALETVLTWGGVKVGTGVGGRG